MDQKDIMNSNNNGWNEWSRHILLELERLNKCVTELTEAINAINLKLTILMVKSGVWGLLAGSIPIAITLLIIFIKGQ
jgi:hypothetical protein